jgi:hypothetical protein
MHFANYIVLDLLIACMLGAAAVRRNCVCLSDEMTDFEAPTLMLKLAND